MAATEHYVRHGRVDEVGGRLHGNKFCGRLVTARAIVRMTILKPLWKNMEFIDRTGLALAFSYLYRVSAASSSQ